MTNATVDLRLSQVVPILEGLGFPVWIARDEKFLYANRAACRLFGVSTSQELARRAVSGHVIHGDSVRILPLEGQPLSVELSTTALRLEGGPAVQYSARELPLRTTNDKLPKVDLTVAELLGGIASWEWDLETQDVHWSPGHYTLLGLRPGSLKPTYEVWRNTVHPQDIAQVEKIATDAVKDGRNYVVEYRVFWPDGTVRWLESRGLLHSGTPGQRRVVGVSVDVTDRKLADDSICENRERLQAALDAAVTGTFRWDLRTNALSWDRNLDRLFGIPENDVVRNLERFISLVHPEDRQRVIDACQACATMGVNFDMEYRVIWPDGSVHWLYDRGQLFKDEDGQPSYMTGACVDITQRKLADSELRIGQERLRIALQFGASGTFDWDIVNNVNSWSEEIERIYGFAPGTFPGTLEDWALCVHPDDLADAQAALENSLQTGEFSSEWRIRRRDTGEVRWIRARAKVLQDDAGRPLRMIGINFDITDKKAVEQIVRRSAQILDQIHDAVIATDLDGFVTLWNNGAAKRFGYSADEVLGKHVSIIYFAEDRPGLLASIIVETKSKGVHEVEVRNRRKDGTEFFGHLSLSLLSDSSGTPVGMIGYTMDITERKRAEHALRVSEKLAATGRLASTLAHEINNPLEALTNIIYLVRHTRTSPEEVAECLRLAELELDRISTITRHLLAFHRQPAQPVQVSMREVIDDGLNLYRTKLETKKIVVRVRHREVPAVRAFPGELRQVFSNILNNAIEASPKGGRITVGLSHVSSLSGDFVRVLVADSGSGIPHEHKARIFEPFYTTKGEKGTGLGLWVSRDLVAKHGGDISVRSNSSGTCFVVTIPVSNVAQMMSRAV